MGMEIYDRIGNGMGRNEKLPVWEWEWPLFPGE